MPGRNHFFEEVFLRVKREDRLTMCMILSCNLYTVFLMDPEFYDNVCSTQFAFPNEGREMALDPY